MRKRLWQNLGRLFVLGFEGKSFPVEWDSLSKEFGPFGIILFSQNIDSSYFEVIERWRQARSLFGCAPLFCIDQEGGRVKRISGEYFEVPAPLNLAQTKSPNEIKNLSRTLAYNLRSIGIGWNLAPVADIYHPECSVIKDRAWHENPQVAARYVCAWVEGQMMEKVASCLKHFPGHGRALVDTHHERSKLNVNLTELWRHEAIPFIFGIRAGAESVMLAHIELQDDKLPSSLSPRVIDYLRSGLKFPGLIVTDDLCMAAVSNRSGIADAATAAISAGCDIAMVSKNADEQAKAMEQSAGLFQSPRFASALSQKIVRATTFWQKFSVQSTSGVLKRLYL